MNSNIVFSYNKKEKTINFKIYSTDKKREQNSSTLIYEYLFFICNKEKRNNSFDQIEENKNI
jgi:hypothetical protein